MSGEKKMNRVLLFLVSCRDHQRRRLKALDLLLRGTASNRVVSSSTGRRKLYSVEEERGLQVPVSVIEGKQKEWIRPR
jgi:hypothetical protein